MANWDDFGDSADFDLASLVGDDPWSGWGDDSGSDPWADYTASDWSDPYTWEIPNSSNDWDLSTLSDLVGLDVDNSWDTVDTGGWDYWEPEQVVGGDGGGEGGNNGGWGAIDPTVDITPDSWYYDSGLQPRTSLDGSVDNSWGSIAPGTFGIDAIGADAPYVNTPYVDDISQFYTPSPVLSPYGAGGLSDEVLAKLSASDLSDYGTLLQNSGGNIDSATLNALFGASDTISPEEGADMLATLKEEDPDMHERLTADDGPLPGYDAAGNWVNDLLVKNARATGGDKAALLASIFTGPATGKSRINQMLAPDGRPTTGSDYGNGGTQRPPIGDRTFPTNGNPGTNGTNGNPGTNGTNGNPGTNTKTNTVTGPNTTLPPTTKPPVTTPPRAVIPPPSVKPPPKDTTNDDFLKKMLGGLAALTQAKAAFSGKKRKAPPAAGPTQGTKAMTWNRMAVGGPVLAPMPARHSSIPRGALGLLRGGQTGQSDKQPIMGSHGEYIMDADVVSALGDGNTEAGAAKLDQMRHAIRAHKRAASAGGIPPKAKSISTYLKGV